MLGNKLNEKVTHIDALKSMSEEDRKKTVERTYLDDVNSAIARGDFYDTLGRKEQDNVNYSDWVKADAYALKIANEKDKGRVINSMYRNSENSPEYLRHLIEENEESFNELVEDPNSEFHNSFSAEAFEERLQNNIPENIKEKYLYDESKRTFHHKNREALSVIKDSGNGKLTTKTNNQAIAQDIIAIAEARGWSKVKLSGTASFRRAAWLEAAAKGIETEGYRPNSKDIAELKLLQDANRENFIENIEELKSAPEAEPEVMPEAEPEVMPEAEPEVMPEVEIEEIYQYYQDQLKNDLEFRSEARREFKELDTKGLVSSAEWYETVARNYAKSESSDFVKVMEKSSEDILAKAEQKERDITGKAFAEAGYITEQDLQEANSFDLDEIKANAIAAEQARIEALEVEESTMIINHELGLDEEPIQRTAPEPRELSEVERLQAEEERIRRDPNSTNEDKVNAKENRKAAESEEIKNSHSYKVAVLAEEILKEPNFSEEAHDYFSTHEGLTSQQEWREILAEEMAKNDLLNDNEKAVDPNEIYEAAHEKMVAKEDALLAEFDQQANYDQEYLDSLNPEDQREELDRFNEELSSLVEAKKLEVKNIDIENGDPTFDSQYESSATRDSRAYLEEEQKIIDEFDAQATVEVAAEEVPPKLDYKALLEDDIDLRAEVRREFKDLDTKGLVSSAEWYEVVANNYAESKSSDFVEIMEKSSEDILAKAEQKERDITGKAFAEAGYITEQDLQEANSFDLDEIKANAIAAEQARIEALEVEESMMIVNHELDLDKEPIQRTAPEPRELSEVERLQAEEDRIRRDPNSTNEDKVNAKENRKAAESEAMRAEFQELSEDEKTAMREEQARLDAEAEFEAIEKDAASVEPEAPAESESERLKAEEERIRRDPSSSKEDKINAKESRKTAEYVEIRAEHLENVSRDFQDMNSDDFVEKHPEYLGTVQRKELAVERIQEDKKIPEEYKALAITRLNDQISNDIKNGVVHEQLDQNKEQQQGVKYQTHNPVYEATVTAGSFAALKEKHDKSYGGDFRSTVTVIDADNNQTSFNTIKDNGSLNYGQYIDNTTAEEINQLKSNNAPAEEIHAAEAKGMDIANKHGIPVLENKSEQEQEKSNDLNSDKDGFYNKVRGTMIHAKTFAELKEKTEAKGEALEKFDVKENGENIQFKQLKDENSEHDGKYVTWPDSVKINSLKSKGADQVDIAQAENRAIEISESYGVNVIETEQNTTVESKDVELEY